MFALTKSFFRSDQEHGISSNNKSGEILDRLFISDLGLPSAEEAFFISEINFNTPSPEIHLQDFMYRQVRVGAYQVGWSSVEDA